MNEAVKFKGNLLLIGSDPFFNSLVEAYIKNNADWKNSLIEIAHCLTEAHEKLIVNPYLLLLVDCQSLKESPLEILIQLKSNNYKCPLVLINNPGFEKTAISCLKHGADYYLVREKNWEEEIPLILETVLEEFDQQTKVKQLLVHLEKENSSLRKLSTLDSQTRFYSAEHFETILSREVKRAIRHDLDLSCFVLDLTSQNSHPFMEEISLLLKSLVRSTDIWARISENRFAALFPHTNNLQAESAVKRITTEIYGKNIKLKLSWGLAHFDKDKVKDELEFFNQALYNVG